MAKKNHTKVVIVVGGILCLVQLALIVLLRPNETPLPPREAMTKAVDSHPNISDHDRPRILTQMALSKFRSDHQRFPKHLKELIPDYLGSLPINPDTGAPFKYELIKGNYVLEELSSTPAVGTNTGEPPRNNPLVADEQSALIASLDQQSDGQDFIYDSTGKRDPFRSYDFSPKNTVRIGNSPLERYSYDELQLTAIIRGMGDPKAVVEDPQGKGHTISINSKVGNLGGQVVQILEDRVVLLETTIEFSGEKLTRTVELYLRNKSDE